MKSYLLMKYEQFLMRLFDRVCKLLSKTGNNWYPKYVLCWDLEDKIMELEREINDLETANIFLHDRIDELEEALCFYEPDEKES